jgi:hypothetical protein
MKRTKRVLLTILISLILLIGSVLLYVGVFLPNVALPENYHVEITNENVSRGEYLANHVMVCIDCHSLRNWELFSGPPVEGTEGGGGEVFGREFGFPGIFYSANITPEGIGHWTDAELFRAITSGVTRDRRSIFPVMPYPEYGKLDQEDIDAVIAFVRSLPSIQASWPKREVDFPVNFIINTIPSKASLSVRPSIEDNIKYGSYMTGASACKDCHTKSVQGKIVGEYMAGGFEFQFPDGSILRSLNITPHESGIGRWNRQTFISRFKAYTDPMFPLEVVKKGDFQTVMPWFMYGGMTEEDLGAIFDYLQTIPAVDNKVERITVALN